jgi:hypothetical protein
MSTIIIISNPPPPSPPQRTLGTEDQDERRERIAQRTHDYNAALRALNEAFTEGCSFRVIDDI